MTSSGVSPIESKGREWVVTNIVRELQTASDWKASVQRRIESVSTSRLLDATQKHDTLECIHEAVDTIKHNIKYGRMVETGTRVCWASSRYARDEARKLRGSSTNSSTATEKPQKDVQVHPAELMYPAYGKEKPSSGKWLARARSSS